MQPINCVIYVRKSTDRGLDQQFNSLDNQEQACRAYIASQAFQGWQFAKTYSDAAISGGTMARPALQELLTDIRAGRIGCVLVYKIDRLSRSIYDFKTMMKEFEKHNCDLVSITQSFDTSSAMGKLTLNMLLSFAEFEREVASERVRDKMRATKAKGMWIGGVPPLGYDIEFGKLVPNQKELPIVRTIFETYLSSRGFNDCCHKLIDIGIRQKQWTTRHGVVRGGRELTPNVVERTLKSEIYLGKLPNKSTGEVFDGLHKPIIDRDLFNRVRDKIADNNNHPGSSYMTGTAVLHNKIMTADGAVFKNKKGNRETRKYRYYRANGISLPMGDIDKLAADNVRAFLNSDMLALAPDIRLMFKQIKFRPEILCKIIDKIIYHDHKMTIFIGVNNTENLREFVDPEYINNMNTVPNFYISADAQHAVIETDVYLHSRSCINNRHAGGGVSVITRDENTTILIRALSYGWRYKRQIESGAGIKEIAKVEQRDMRTIYKYLNLTYLSPRIINDIMAGKIPSHINLIILMNIASKYEKFADQEQEFYR